MLKRVVAFLSLLLAPVAGDASEEVVLGLSSDKVSITTRFDGDEILIFGAVKREGPIPEGPALEVIVTVAGPSQPVVVRRKEHKLGIWVNAASVTVDSAPSFYAVASSAPLEDILPETEDLRYKITVDKAIRSVGAPDDVDDAQAFTEAVIRIHENEGLYQHLTDTVAVDEQTLFRTAIDLPANLTEGDYVTRIFLLREGAVVSTHETTIDVQKVGLERWLFTLSRQNPVQYGLMSLAIAIIAGWSASAAFRLLRER